LSSLELSGAQHSVALESGGFYASLAESGEDLFILICLREKRVWSLALKYGRSRFVLKFTAQDSPNIVKLCFLKNVSRLVVGVSSIGVVVSAEARFLSRGKSEENISEKIIQ
jgi:hypothetical protein